jgi:hypothetical protein
MKILASMYNETFDGKRKMKIVKGQVMEHFEGVEEARYYVKHGQKEIDLTEIAREAVMPTSIYRRIELPSDDTMKEKTRA